VIAKSADADTLLPACVPEPVKVTGVAFAEMGASASNAPSGNTLFHVQNMINDPFLVRRSE
jgi:hypothetical protein